MLGIDDKLSLLTPNLSPPIHFTLHTEVSPSPAPPCVCEAFTSDIIQLYLLLSHHTDTALFIFISPRSFK
jgi:hypothetical protein